MFAVRAGLLLFSVLAVAALLNSPVGLPAQAPPIQPTTANPDTEKRLKAMEEQMERMLKLLEARERDLQLSVAGAAMQELVQARDKLQSTLAAKEKQRDVDRHAVAPLLEKLRAIEMTRGEIRMDAEDLRKRLERVEKVYKEKGAEEALRVINTIVMNNWPKTVPSELDKLLLDQKIRRAMALTQYGEGHPSVKAIDSAIEQITKLYGERANAAAQQPIHRAEDKVERHIEVMKAEIADNTIRLKMYDELYDKEIKLNPALGDALKREAKFNEEIKTLREVKTSLDKMIQGAK